MAVGKIDRTFNFTEGDVAQWPYKPMLLSTATKWPLGPEWVYELKLDGYRMMVYLSRGKVTLVSRWGVDWTAHFPALVAALPKAIKGKQCVLDGELVALDDQGHPRLSRLRRKQGRIVYYAFDLLELNGKQLTACPWVKRRAALRRILKPSDFLYLSEEFTDGEALLREVIKRDLEGIVAKHKDSLYRPRRRTQHWLKIRVRPKK